MPKRRTIRVTEPESPYADRHAFRASRTLCGKGVSTHAKTRSTTAFSRITCSTCRLILSANPSRT